MYKLFILSTSEEPFLEGGGGGGEGKKRNDNCISPEGQVGGGVF